MTNLIIYPQDNGSIALVAPTGAIPVEAVAQKDVPAGKPFFIVSPSALPADHTFFNAWEADFTGKDGRVSVNMTKAKVIAHDRRRAARAEEFAPLDDIIAKRIPGTTAEEAEAGRQRIRDKYAKQQAAIDAATTIDQLKEALK